MDNEKTFEQMLLEHGRPRNMLLAAISAFYIYFFSGIPYRYIGTQFILILIGIVICAALFMQFVVAPLVNHLAVGKVSQMFKKEMEEYLSDEERTVFVKMLMRAPIHMAVTVGLVFMIAIIILSGILYKFFVPNFFVVIHFLINGVFVSYASGLMGFSYTEQICSYWSIAEIRRGVDAEAVRKEKYFGMGFFYRMVFFNILFCMFINLTTFLFFQQNMAMHNLNSFLNGTGHFLVLILVNTVLAVSFAVLLYRQLSRSFVQINTALEKLLIAIESADAYLPTDLGNEFAYNFFLINDTVKHLHSEMKDMMRTGQDILQSTEKLSNAAKTISDISSEETGNIKKCQTTIESSKTILQNVYEITTNAGIGIGETKFDIDTGYELLKKEIVDKKIHEITDANIDTIAGIKALNEKIDNLWEIINAIDVIAEKTKTIAFNAELQTTKLGETSETFHILGNEIRRLATMTTLSTQNIKEYIKAIQEFSDNLIVTSEVGTQKIREGSVFYTLFENTFADLRTTTDIAAESAMSVQEMTDMQVTSFNQINVMFEQMQMGFRELTETAQYLDSISENLRKISDQLKM